MKQDIVILCGGRTGGPVLSMVSVWEEIAKKYPNYKLLIADIDKSIGQKVAAANPNYLFKRFYEAKLYRYLTLRNFLLPFKFIFNIYIILKIIYTYNVKTVYSSGGFIALPIMLIAYICGIPCHIHQQDLEIGLSNKLARFFTKSISVSFKEQLYFFNQRLINLPILFHNHNRRIVEYTGNPYYLKNTDNIEITMSDKLPTILIIGGAGGSLFLNNFVRDNLEEVLEFANIIWITGEDYNYSTRKYSEDKLRIIKYTDSIIAYFKAADLIISRGGLGTITDLLHLRKAAVLIPMQGTHQEYNVDYFTNKHKVFWQSTEQGFDIAELRKYLNKVMWKDEELDYMRKESEQFIIEDAKEQIAKMIINNCIKKN